MRWTVALADDPAGGATAEAIEPAGPGRFHVLIAVEDVWSGDGRQFTAESLTWRDLPLPLMGLDRTTAFHDQAVLIGNIDKIERQGTQIHGWGPFLSEPDGEAAAQIGLIQRGELRGVSADVDAVEYEILLPADDSDALFLFADDSGDGEGEEVVIPITEPRQRITEGRVMGCTVVPFPAFQECFIEMDGESAPAAPAPAPEPAPAAVVASVAIPVEPPASWFQNPAFLAIRPVTITDGGRIWGHLAAWGTCHVSFPDECREPPHSDSNYAWFHTGEVACTDGTRWPVGHLSSRGGHAGLNMGAAAAKAYYDDTDSVIADVRVGEDAYGIWMTGALRPGTRPEDVRVAMASDVSGDWRRIGGTLELIHLSCVNVPGFHKRAYVREQEGSLVAAVLPLQPRKVTWDRVAERIAASIGRDRASRLAELDRLVHGGS